MDHLAIMRKSWGLTQKILTGQKRVESRWYMTKRLPFDGITCGDTVYFKDSGEPVTIKAEVSGVKQFSNLTPKEVRRILEEYGEADGIKLKQIREFFERFKDKKYCILIYLKNPVQIKPFTIDKTGYGNMAAWITVDSINKIRVK